MHPDALVGFERDGHFDFYGEDAKRVSEILGNDITEIFVGEGLSVDRSRLERERFAESIRELWGRGENIFRYPYGQPGIPGGFCRFCKRDGKPAGYDDGKGGTLPDLPE